MGRKRLSGYSLGLYRELKASANYHQHNIALLIDPTLLRSFGLGQIDLAVFLRNKILILEVKGQSYPHQSQYIRIRKTARWLGDLFKYHVQIQVYLSQGESDDKNNTRQEELRFLP